MNSAIKRSPAAKIQRAVQAYQRFLDIANELGTEGICIYVREGRVGDTKPKRRVITSHAIAIVKQQVYEMIPHDGQS